MTEPAISHPAGVIEHNGMLWKPEPDATATADEFIAAQALYLAIHKDKRWNPWVAEDRADDLDRAMAVMDQWTRAESDFHQQTEEEWQAQWDAKCAERARTREQERAAEEALRQERKRQFDPQRAQARLALLEDQSILDRTLEELAEWRDGTRFPACSPARRDTEITGLENKAAKMRIEVERLQRIVEDPEAVIAEHGRLPCDRREISLVYFVIDRERTVRELRVKVPELQAAIKASKDRNERASLRADLSLATHKLDKLLAIPPLTADDMCSECPTPAARHGWVTSTTMDGPCPAWPGWAARIQRAREMILAASPNKPTPSPTPKPKPIAVVPSGLPIAEVIRRLTEIQQSHPNAEVRRGHANRWEIWPAKVTLASQDSRSE
ncbi:conserved hypothetical protein [Frankia sp. Hr75.2]|nr:conserved hypothetical protein [Frankia sp. Hr75.2]